MPHIGRERWGRACRVTSKKQGHSTAWLIVTGIPLLPGGPSDQVNKRNAEIDAVSKLLQFDEVYKLELPTTQLDQIPTRDLVAGISEVFRRFQPNEIFVPHYSDIHSDHRVVFQAVASCTKWFRHASVQRILCYETLSETDFSLGEGGTFTPNYFLDISSFLEGKLAALRIYASELGCFPFPRSEESVRAQATLRGAASGFNAAEAFELLRERN